MMLKVLLSRNAGTRYRFPQFVPYLARNGIHVDLERIDSSPLKFFRMLHGLKEADIVVILRKLMPRWKQKLLRRFAKKIIFEYDDAIMYRSSRWENQHSGTRTRRFRDMLKICDAVIAGNKFLRAEALKYVKEEKVHIIPTVVDIERYSPRTYDVARNGIIIGWLGSRGTLHYLKNLLPVFEDIGKKFPSVQLKIVCNDFFDVSSMGVIKKEWSEADEVDDLRSFDIGLGPLTDDVWTRGKCGLKLIQYLAVGVPVICSPVGANKEIVIDGEVGLWASDRRAWIDKLSLLIDKPELRKKMGEKGRERIKKQYSLQAMGPKLIAMITQL